MHRREIRERAALLRRLGYTRDAAAERLQRYEAWEYEPFHTSPLFDEVRTIVSEVFAPGSRGSTRCRRNSARATTRWKPGQAGRPEQRIVNDRS